MNERVIIHLDLDAFYASVEQRDHPELRGRPVIVGGSRQRGVVCACSYEARAFGVRSAMPISRAVRLCPQGVILPVRMGRYREASEQVQAIFERYTDRIEPLSLDEAFLDVSDCRRLFGSGREIAERIRREVREETGLTISAGIAANKLLAKLASDAGKPDGLLEIAPEQAAAFVDPLPVGRLWGVGATTAARLEGMGLRMVADLRQASRQRLERQFGRLGGWLHELAQGEDSREVEPQRELKSVSHEETFEHDLADPEQMLPHLLRLAEQVARRLRRQELGGRGITLGVRYDDFRLVTRSRTLEQGVSNGKEIFNQVAQLLRETEAGARPVRLLRVAVSRLEPAGNGQSDLFGEELRERLARLDQALDVVCDRFGSGGITRATLLAPQPPGSPPKKRREGGK